MHFCENCDGFYYLLRIISQNIRTLTRETFEYLTKQFSPKQYSGSNKNQSQDFLEYAERLKP